MLVALWHGRHLNPNVFTFAKSPAQGSGPESGTSPSLGQSRSEAGSAGCRLQGVGPFPARCNPCGLGEAWPGPGRKRALPVYGAGGNAAARLCLPLDLPASGLGLGMGYDRVHRLRTPVRSGSSPVWAARPTATSGRVAQTLKLRPRRLSDRARLCQAVPCPPCRAVLGRAVRPRRGGVGVQGHAGVVGGWRSARAAGHNAGPMRARRALQGD